MRRKRQGWWLDRDQFVQAGLASAHQWVGGLHPLLALVLLSFAATLALRGLRRHRQPAP